MCITQSCEQSPRRSVRRAMEKHLRYRQSVFTAKTEWELNIPDLVKLGRSERAALGRKISVSSLQCARPSVMQLSRHASDLPLLPSTSKHAAGIKSLTLIGKPRTCRPGYEIVILQMHLDQFSLRGNVSYIYIPSLHRYILYIYIYELDSLMTF